MENKTEEKYTQEEIDNLVGFFEVLYNIHCRLIGEGWRVVDGEMIPPLKKK